MNRGIEMIDGYKYNSKKILIIMTTPLKTSGITTAVMNHLKFLNNKTNEIVLAYWNNAENYIITQLGENVSHIQLPPRKNVIKYFIFLTRYIKKEKFDVVHVHGNSSSMILEMVPSIFCRVKNRIVHSHSTHCNNELINNILKPVFKLTYNKALACSNYSGKWLFKKDYIVMKNGFDLNAFSFRSTYREAFRKELNIDDETIVFGMIGSLTKVKNHTFILSVFEKVNSKVENSILVIIGDGDLRSKLEDEIYNKNYNNSILFLGKRSDISIILSGIDLFLMPSLYEGLPFAALEAQASGLPCILSNKISTEVRLSNLVNFVELDEMKWVDILTNTKIITDRDNSSRDAIVLMSSEGYDIRSEIQELEDIYSNPRGGQR